MTVQIGDRLRLVRPTIDGDRAETRIETEAARKYAEYLIERGTWELVTHGEGTERVDGA